MSDFLAQLKQLVDLIEYSIFFFFFLRQRNHFGQGHISAEWHKISELFLIFLPQFSQISSLGQLMFS